MPTSAVHTIGSDHLVDVVDGTSVKPVRVTTGTVGDTLTQVTSGLSRGQLVSLASLSEPLPSSSTTTHAVRRVRWGVGAGGCRRVRWRRAGGAGFGGGGFGGGGFGRGGFGG